MKRFFVLGFLFGAIVFGGTMFFASALFAENVSVGTTVPAICGNNVAEGSEVCDGSDLKSQTCVTKGFDSGTLVCTACAFVTTGCANNAPAEFCGNGACGGGETCSSCSADCGSCPVVCGDGSCNGSETSVTCPADCAPPAPVCGDSSCNGTETCSTCSADCGVCPAVCGDSVCGGAETCSSCASDCGVCPAVCGNGSCEETESCLACPGDCGVCPVEAFCGDNSCNGTENCSSCSADCGTCSAVCGDGSCNGSESCSSCSADCGACVDVGGGDEGSGDTGGETGGGGGGGGIFTPNNPAVNPIVGEAINQVFNLIQRNEFVQNQIERIEEITQEVATQARADVVGVARDIQAFANNEQVQEATKNVIAPSLVITSAAIVTPSLLSILFPLLRFLFLQPLLLLGWRKKKAWGMVYNSVTKLPLDLATIRLIDAVTNRVIQSRVTDAKGRYLFIVNPGSYLLEITKPGFVYPSLLLATVKADGRVPDLYHGEKIEVTEEDTLVTPNIPVDPLDSKIKSIKRIAWEKFARVFQHVVSIVGVVATLVALYITPVWYIWVFLVFHILLYIMFLRFIKPKKPKGWGIVYDKDEKKPLGSVITRLFSKEYNKLVASQTTDSKGRYAFLVGPSNYYVTFEKKGYKQGKTQDIILKDAEDVVVKEDVALEKDKGGLDNTFSGTQTESPPIVIPPADVLPAEQVKKDTN